MNIILDKKNEKHRLLNARQKKGLIFLTHGFSDIYITVIGSVAPWVSPQRRGEAKAEAPMSLINQYF